MSDARKIFSNTVVQIVGKGLMALLSIVAVKILTSYLGKDLYGQYNTIYIYLAFFSIIADLGIYTIAVREMSRKEAEVSSIIGNILSIRTILSVLVVAVAVIISLFIPQYNNSFIAWGIIISGVGTIISLINGVLVSVFQTYLKMQYATISLLVGKVISVVGLAAVAFWLLPEKLIANNPEKLSLAFYATIFVGIISSIAMVVVTLFYSKKIVKINYKFDWSIWKKLIKESLPYGIALILGTMYLRLDGLMLSLLRGTEDVGIYSVATKVIEVINILPVLFLGTVLPVLIRYLEEKSQKVQELLKHSFTFLFATALPILIGLFLLAYQIIYLISTPEFLTDTATGFYGSDLALKILAFGLFTSFINNIFIYLLIAINQQKKLLFINGAAVVLNIILNLFVIPRWGFQGASLVTVLSEVFVLCCTFYHSRKYLKFRVDIPALIKISVSGALMAIIIYFLKEPLISRFDNKGMILLMALGGFLYILFLILTRAITKDHLKMILSKEAKTEATIDPVMYE